MSSERMRDLPDIPDIAVKYTVFPPGYVNDVRGWSFEKAMVVGNAGRLLTLDIDFGAKCSLNCPFCFRRGSSVDEQRRELRFRDLVGIVLQARALGLRTVKFLGAGEPLENPSILEFLQFLKSLDIIPVIFTKTGVIGDDARVRRLFSYKGIHTGEELAGELDDCGASMVVGFNSFKDEVQQAMCGDGARVLARRNRTLEILSRAGFNDPNPTRLALGVNPVTKSNYDEALEIYKWARLRNIYAIVTPTMISGRAKNEVWKSITPSGRELIELYTEIYRFNLDTGLMTLDQILEEGISAYGGAHPCNQVAAGLYVTLNGVVLSCPGSEDSVEGNVWRSPLSEIWAKSVNFTRAGTFNCRCIAKDGKSIPADLYDRVLANIMASWGGR